MSIDSQFLESLLHEEEGTTIDFKQAAYRFNGARDEEKSELLKDVLAFANSWRRTDAYILIGVEEIKGGRSKPVGVADHIDDANLQQFINSRTNKPIQISVHTVTIDGVQIDVIKIPLQDRPIYLTKSFGKLQANQVPIRRGSSTSFATPDEIAQMGIAKIEAEDTVDTPSLTAYLARNLTELFSSEKSFSVFELTCSIPIPDYPREIFSLPILDYDRTLKNKNYYRNYFYYQHEFARALPLHMVIENSGNSTARDISLELILRSSSKEMEIRALEEMPAQPSPLMLAMHPASTNTLSSDIQIVNTKGLHKIEAHVDHLQAKRKWFSKAQFFLLVTESAKVQIEANVFATGLSSPIKSEFEIAIECSMEEISLYSLMGSAESPAGG